MSSNCSAPTGNLVEILPGRLYFCSYDDAIRPKADSETSYLNVDIDVHYESFYTDFGPLNLSVLYRFCKKMNSKLRSSKKRIIFYTSSNGHRRVNGAFLIGAFAMINCDMTSDEVWVKIKNAQPPKFHPYRDAAMGPSTYDLLLLDVFRGIEQAIYHKWLNFASFDPDEYEFYERVENGDFNWVIPSKVISFCGPHNKSVIDNGYPYHAPEVYFDYFRRNNITTIIRLNRKMYDAKRFVDAGFEHVDLFFVDGSTPSDTIVRRFIEVVDRAAGAVAVHCKAGLGRTGTLIACWMMKHYGVSAAECIAWIRICRPGSIIGPQQQFLIDKQRWCWSLGRARKDLLNGDSRSESNQVLANGNVTHLTSKVDDIRLNQLQKSALNRPNSLPRRTRRSFDATADNTTDETALDCNGRSQGDRLLCIKAAKQNHLSQPLSVVPPTGVRFTSPTTPVKPIAPPSSRNRLPVNVQLGSQRRLRFNEIVPAQKVARVTVTQTSLRFRSNGLSAGPSRSSFRAPAPVPRPRIVKSRTTTSASTVNSSPAPVPGFFTKKATGSQLRVRPYPVLSSKSSSLVPLLQSRPYQLRSTQQRMPCSPIRSLGTDYAATLPPNSAALLGPRKNAARY